MKNLSPKKGFTLIELLVVVAIVGLLASVILASVNGARNKAYVSVTANTQRELHKAIEMYDLDMGFYPPDTLRGWDPGLAKKLPYNTDTAQDCAVNALDCPTCTNCPANWVTQVQTNWRGPYMTKWPDATPWGGEYDYNYWATATLRYGCTVPAGIYAGAEPDYNDLNGIPAAAEQILLNKKLDNDGCLDGESQILLTSLP